MTIVGKDSSAFALISIATAKSGIINMRYPYPGDVVTRLKRKMDTLAGIPAGATSTPTADSRFSYAIPNEVALAHGLQPDGDKPYLIDVRVGYARTFNGHGFTCRLLDQQVTPDLDGFNLTRAQYETLMRIINRPSGLVLVTGPMGSGKTSLLFALIKRLNNGQRPIFTIEDPVEFTIVGKNDAPVRQIQLSGDLSVERALESMLRSASKIVMFGEIRTKQMMEYALQAAQTGGLVLGTLHTNNGPETFARALDLCCDRVRDAVRLSEVLKLVLAVRLIDRYPGESKERALTKEELMWSEIHHIPASVNGLVKETISQERDGKIPIMEMVEVTPEVKAAVRSGQCSSDDIYKIAAEQLQYESLPLAGMRAVESQGALLSDCMFRLDGVITTDCDGGLRSRMARKYGISLQMVSDTIDSYHGEPDNSHDIESFFELRFGGAK